MNPTYSKNLAGKRLQRARKKAGLTQEQCAQILQNTTDPKTNSMRISRHERGITSLPPEDIHALAPHLNTTPAYLLLLTTYENTYTIKDLNNAWQKGYDRGHTDALDLKETQEEK